jgi:N-acetylneuraminate synthase
MNHPDHVYVIAEAGVNHNGDLARALEMIEVAADAGADAVKFQSFLPEALASPNAPKAGYQRRNEPGSESQLAMLSRLALDFDDQHRLFEYCRERGIDFLSSPFDPDSARFLHEELRLQTIKLGSGELTNAPLLWLLAEAGVRLILSTGMATLDEVRTALGVCCLALDGIEPGSAAQALAAYEPARLVDRVTLMHCTTAYPCPPGEINLRAMDTLREATGLTVGYSDHSEGIAVSLAAVARGARLIEKHFTLDRGLPGPDHAASLTPAELGELVQGIRTVSLALGSADKGPSATELANAAVARKSLVAARPIRAGEPFDRNNLTSKRPGAGLSPLRYWSLLGRPARFDYAADDPIREDE